MALCFKILVSTCLVLVYRNAVGFHVLILNIATLVNSPVIRSFLVDFWGFLYK